MKLRFPAKIPLWVGLLVGALAIAVLFLRNGGAEALASCPGSLVYCPGVGCVSGMDKCVSGSTGGPNAVFSKETFVNPCTPMKTCPDGTRTDGPCLME